MTNRWHLSRAFAWNICFGMKDRKTYFWVILSKGTSPGVCTVIQRLYTCVSSGNICHLPDWKRVTSYPAPVRWYCWHYSSLIVDLCWKAVYPRHHRQCWLLQWNPGTLECNKDSETRRLSYGIILHDSARPYSAMTTCEKLHQFQWEDFPHPPYSVDLSPCGCHVFGPM